MKYEIEGYLTEEKIKHFVIDVIEPEEISCQHKVKLQDRNVKVDIFFVKNDIPFFVEFNGHYHYTSTNNIIRDIQLTKYCLDNDIILIEFPYFIQLTNETYKIAFEKIHNENVNIICNFSHGFNDKACTLPYDFTSEGYKRYLSDIARFKVYDTVESSYTNIKNNLILPW